MTKTLLGLLGLGRAEEVPTVIGVGAWSKPVADRSGYAIRGRLVLEEKRIDSDRRAVGVYIELRDASEFIGSSMRVFCDLGRHDFRPEYRSGLHCELRDQSNRPVPDQPFPFSGALPLSQWVILPPDATIRLRASPFGIHRPHAWAICPQADKLWVIAENDPNPYFLSGTLTVEPPGESTQAEGAHIWRGTIVFPPVRIINESKNEGKAARR